jgi:hypothetical protein
VNLDLLGSWEVALIGLLLVGTDQTGIRLDRRLWEHEDCWDIFFGWRWSAFVGVWSFLSTFLAEYPFLSSRLYHVTPEHGLGVTGLNISIA